MKIVYKLFLALLWAGLVLLIDYFLYDRIFEHSNSSNYLLYVSKFMLWGVFIIIVINLPAFFLLRRIKFLGFSLWIIFFILTSVFILYRSASSTSILTWGINGFPIPLHVNKAQYIYDHPGSTCFECHTTYFNFSSYKKNITFEEASKNMLNTAVFFDNYAKSKNWKLMCADTNYRAVSFSITTDVNNKIQEALKKYPHITYSTTDSIGDSSPYILPRSRCWFESKSNQRISEFRLVINGGHIFIED